MSFSLSFWGIWLGVRTRTSREVGEKKKRGKMILRCSFVFICLINSWLMRSRTDFVSLSLGCSKGGIQSLVVAPRGFRLDLLGKTGAKARKMHIALGQGQAWQGLCPLVSLGVWHFSLCPLEVWGNWVCVPWCHWRCGRIEISEFRAAGNCRAHLGHSGKLLGVQRENEKCHCVKLLSHIRLLKFHFTALKFLW